MRDRQSVLLVGHNDYLKVTEKPEQDEVDGVF